MEVSKTGITAQQLRICRTCLAYNQILCCLTITVLQYYHTDILLAEHVYMYSLI